MDETKIKPGQVWQQANGEVFVVTFIDVHTADNYIIYRDGYSTSYILRSNAHWPFVFNNLLNEYPTWQEAINSKEFRGEENV